MKLLRRKILYVINGINSSEDCFSFRITLPTEFSQGELQRLLLIVLSNYQISKDVAGC